MYPYGTYLLHTPMDRSCLPRAYSPSSHRDGENFKALREPSALFVTCVKSIELEELYDVSPQIPLLF